MIQTIDKDILTVDYGFIIHCCNCIGAFGGLAGKIGKKWPNVKEKYVEHLRQSVVKGHPAWDHLGTNLYVDIPDQDITVVNMFTQYDIGMECRRTEYSALKTCLKEFIGMPEGFPIYMPYQLGSGMGGGDWGIIQDIINHTFRHRAEQTFICRI